MFSKKCSIAACVAIAIAVMFLAGSMAANAGIIAEEDFNDIADLTPTEFANFDAGGGTVDTTDDELDYYSTNNGSAGFTKWNLTAGGENILSDVATDNVFTVSWDARANNSVDNIRTEFYLGRANGTGTDKMFRLRYEVDPLADTILELGYNSNTTEPILTVDVGTYYHYDLVVNRYGTSAGDLANYNGTQDLAYRQADLWIDGVLAAAGFDIWDGVSTYGAKALDYVMLKHNSGKDSDMSFDNFEIRDAAYVEVPEPATMSMLLMAIGGLALLLRRRR